MLSEYLSNVEYFTLMFFVGVAFLSFFIDVVSWGISSLIIYVKVEPKERKYYKIFQLTHIDFNDPSLKRLGRFKLIMIVISIVIFLLTIISLNLYIGFSIDSLFGSFILSFICCLPIFNFLAMIERMYTEFVWASIFNKFNNKFIH